MAVAALVIGLPDFSGYCSNNGGISASSLNRGQRGRGDN